VADDLPSFSETGNRRPLKSGDEIRNQGHATCRVSAVSLPQQAPPAHSSPSTPHAPLKPSLSAVVIAHPVLPFECGAERGLRQPIGVAIPRSDERAASRRMRGVAPPRMGGPARRRVELRPRALCTPSAAFRSQIMGTCNKLRCVRCRSPRV
jgi:hypothetical protein